MKKQLLIILILLCMSVTSYAGILDFCKHILGIEVDNSEDQNNTNQALNQDNITTKEGNINQGMSAIDIGILGIVAVVAYLLLKVGQHFMKSPNDMALIKAIGIFRTRKYVNKCWDADDAIKEIFDLRDRIKNGKEK